VNAAHTWNTSRDDGNINAGQSSFLCILSLLSLASEVALSSYVTADFLFARKYLNVAVYARSRSYRNRGDVGEVSGNTGGVDHIEERELINMRGDLAKQRQRLWQGQSVCVELKCSVSLVQCHQRRRELQL
jgi:hypothetical protein